MQKYLKPFVFTVLTASIYNMHRINNFLQGPIMTAVKTTDIAISTRNNNDCNSRVHNTRDIKMYSQNDEDGALLQTLRCMRGHGPKEYFEFGSESGVEVNTRILRDLHGWTGHLLDGSQENPDIALHKRLETNWSALPGLEKAISDKESGVVSIYDYNSSDKTWQ